MTTVSAPPVTTLRTRQAERSRPLAREAVAAAAATLLAALGLVCLAGSAPARAASARPPCDAATRARALSPAAPGDDEIRLTCSLSLHANEHIERRILIEGAAGSGVTLDCGGGVIGPARARPFGAFSVEIRSAGPRPGRDGQPVWEPVTDVTLRGCSIRGDVRVWGMAMNGQGAALRDSSRALGHTDRAQAAAPSRIAILDSTLTGLGSIPLYLGPGVTASVLRGSRLRGTSRSVAVYLDAESAHNTIEGNDFNIETGREAIAVDGSAENRIVGNRFVLRGARAVDLYRNCGEGGTVRHQTPSDNVITGNVFVRHGLWRPDPVKVGAREGWRLYCGEDAGYPFGSSADDGDNARGNVVDSNVTE